MASVAEIEYALRAADAAGATEDATALAEELRSRRAEEGQPSPEVGPLGNGAAAGPTDDAFGLPFADTEAGGAGDPFAGGLPEDDTDPFGGVDPLANVAEEINGVALPDQLRQRIASARGIEDPREQRIETLRIGARIQALSLAGEDEGGTAVTTGMALLRGIGAGQFGLGDLAAAAGTFVGTDLDFEESLEYEREFRRALEEQHPGVAFAGEIVGAITGGGAALKGAQALAKGTKAAKLVKKATVFTKGGGAKGFAKNVLRSSVAGGAAAGITEGITEGEPLPGVAIGVAAGPLGPGIVKVASVTGPMIKRFLQDPATKGIRMLAKRLDETADEMARRFLEFQMVLGRVPSIADISNPRAVADMRKLISEKTGAVDIAREEAEAVIRRRPGELAKEVTGGRVTTTKRAQEAARTRRGDIQFAKVREQNFTFEPEDITDILENRDVVGILPSTAKAEIREAIEAVTEKGELTGPISLGGDLVEDLRQALSAAAKTGKGFPRRFLALRDELEELAFGQFPPYRVAVKESAERAARAEGVVAGRKVTAPETTAEFEAAIEAADELSTLAGTRVGARTALPEAAREGPAQAAALARRLSAEGGLIQRLRAILPKREVDRLQEVGRLHARSAENVARLAPSVRAEETKVVQEAVRDTIGALVVAGGNTGGAFKATLFSRTLGRMGRAIAGPSKKTIESMARDIFDPAKTDDVIKALRRAGLGDENLLDLFATAVASANLAAAQL